MADPRAEVCPSEIILPDLPPKFADLTFDGPAIHQEEVSTGVDLAEIAPGSEFLVAGRESRVGSMPDARDRRRDAFSTSPATSESPDIRAGSIWCPPKSLYARLTRLTKEPPTAAWAEHAWGQVRRLGHMVDDGEVIGPDVFDSLRTTVEQTDSLAAQLADEFLATELRRAGYALRRRLDVWQRVLPAVDAPVEEAEIDLDRVRLALADVDAAVRDSSHGRAWREYLLLDALAEASRKAADPDGDQRRAALARRIFARVAQTPLTEAQQRFLASAPMDRLASELRRMAVRRPDRAALLAAMERYETSGRPCDARRLAEECFWLGFVPKNQCGDLHRQVTMHYRNANLRVEVTETLLNRLMPERLPELEQVYDTVLGNPVRGQSLTATEVAIRLIPDPQRVHLALEISGEVAALTSSSSGPAIFQNASESRYTARKPMELTVDGLVLHPAEIDRVSNVTRLRRLQTAFDGVPLIGALIHNAARVQHDMKRTEVRHEIERKVAARARRRIDEEANERLAELSDRLEKHVLEPIHDLALGPRMIEASTTEDHLTMRLRVASARQLGAHTPRPKTPADSLASFQIHQSTMNNLIERLDLAGKTFTLPELRRRIAQRLHWAELEEKTTDHDDVTIAFAETDPIRVTCDEGQVTIDLSIARLSKSPRVWRDFQVRVHYRPQVEGLSAELARDGVVQLPGGQIPTRAQIPLRGIFSKLFSRNQTRQLVPDRIRNHPKMTDVAVTQMTIEDGWIAVALGPEPRVAQAPSKNTK
ncbi:MAG: hypothetical protein JW719_10020 [Pirellulales bacterium]|nr:hypothetical protein [Pirellulales bacterium]